MSKSRYPDPDGYVKMSVRDLIAGVIVVSLFALAALLSHIWRNIVRKTSQGLHTKPIKLANQDK